MSHLDKLGQNTDMLKISVPEVPEVRKAPVKHDAEVQIAQLRTEAPPRNIETKDGALNSFESIKESLSDKEEIGRLFNVFEEYINPKLEVFTGVERENIKLVIWNEFQDLFSVQGSLGVLIGSVSEGIRHSLKPLSEVKANEEGEKKVEDMIEAGKKILSDFGTDPDTKSGVLEYLDKKLGTNLDTLTEMKQKYPSLDFSQLSVIEQILAGSTDVASIQTIRTNEEISQEIKRRTNEVAASFEGKAELGTQLAKMIEGLPVGGDAIKQAIAAMVERFPILGFLVSMFMGEDFLDGFVSGKNKERKDSFENLIALSEDSLSPVSGIFPEGFNEEFDISRLEVFYKYLEENKINYKKAGFWEELLSGKTEDENIKNLSDILKGKYGERILSSKDSENNGKGLIKKLNSLPKIISDTAQAEAEAALDAEGKALFGKSEAIPVSVTTPTEQSGEPLETSEDTPDTTEAQATTGLEEVDVSTEEAAATLDKIRRAREFSHNSVKTSINGATKLPMQINYGGNEGELEKLGIPVIKEIDFQDGKLIVGGNEYEIQFGEFTHNAPIVGDIQIKGLHISGTPKITSSDILLNCKTEDLGGFIGIKEQNKSLPKEKFSEIILGILKNGNHSDTIPASGKTSEISFNVIKTASASSIA